MKMRAGQEYTLNEVAEYCHRDYHTVWRAVKSGTDEDLGRLKWKKNVK